jgi:uncharacterized protein YciI
MNFLVIARDGADPDAPARRQAAREAHLAGARTLKEEGRMLFGAALLDDAGRMIGSAMLVDFPGRAEVDAWLAVDPYTTGGVWREVEVTPCKVSVK